jgi:dTDP-4-dehydrorhamnose 3,5-epimerase-like enzyme
MTVRLIKIETHDNVRGNIGVIENPPFPIKRVFYIYNVPVGVMRGGHAHKTCKQLFISVCGAVRVLLGDGKQFILDCPDEGLYVPPRHIIHLEFLTEDTTLLVLANKKYDEEDYVYGEG